MTHKFLAMVNISLGFQNLANTILYFYIYIVNMNFKDKEE